MWLDRYQLIKVFYCLARFGGGGVILMVAIGIEVMVTKCFKLLKRKKIPDALSWIRSYCLFLKDMDWKHMAYHIKDSDPGHTRCQQQLDKNLKITFASPSGKTIEKRKENNGNCKTFLRYMQTQSMLSNDSVTTGCE